MTWQMIVSGHPEDEENTEEFEQGLVGELDQFVAGLDTDVFEARFTGNHLSVDVLHDGDETSG